MPNEIRVDAGPVNFEFTVSIDVNGIEVVPADKVKVEDSQTPKYLPLRSGHLTQIYSEVWVSIAGEWYEITKDSPPDKPSVTLGQISEATESLRKELKDAEGRLMEKIDDLGQLTYDVHQRLGPRPGELTQDMLDGLT